jgi:hypothetical protein
MLIFHNFKVEAYGNTFNHKALHIMYYNCSGRIRVTVIRTCSLPVE